MCIWWDDNAGAPSGGLLRNMCSEKSRLPRNFDTFSVHQERRTNSFGYFGFFLIVSFYVHLGFLKSHSQARLLKNWKFCYTTLVLFLSLFPFLSFSKLKYLFKTSIETTPSIELSWLRWHQVSSRWATPIMQHSSWCADGRQAADVIYYYKCALELGRM